MSSETYICPFYDNLSGLDSVGSTIPHIYTETIQCVWEISAVWSIEIGKTAIMTPVLEMSDLEVCEFKRGD